ncbi:MAG TPA: RloB family protein [Waterburya sp.]
MPRKLNRRPPRRDIVRKIVIACEGSKTEPGYFESIRKELRLQTLQIVVLRHQGQTDPRSIIERVIEERQEMKRNQAWTDGDSAWAVFDGDEHIEQSPTNWKSSIALAKKQKIQLAITNPCFELWYLIHFQDHFSQIPRNRVINLLEKHISNYDKSMCLYPKPLKPLTEKAIQRAERIAAQIQRNELNEHSNPCCTGLPKLVQSLLNLENG